MRFRNAIAFLSVVSHFDPVLFIAGTTIPSLGKALNGLTETIEETDSDLSCIPYVPEIGLCILEIDVPAHFVGIEYIPSAQFERGLTF